MSRKPALGCRCHFLCEARIKPYMKYGEGALEQKNGICAKTFRGVVSYAGWQVERVQVF